MVRGAAAACIAASCIAATVCLLTSYFFSALILVAQFARRHEDQGAAVRPELHDALPAAPSGTAPHVAHQPETGGDRGPRARAPAVQAYGESGV